MLSPSASSAASPSSELAPPTGAREVVLVIEGMTSTGCVARIERSLTRLEITHLRVDLAAGRASITVPDGAATAAQLVAAVRHAGYDALPADRTDAPATAVELAEARRLAYRRRTLLSALAAIPVLLLSDVPGIDVSGWQWIALALTTPVVLWAGAPIHLAAWRGARDLQLSPDTLAALAALAALAWSAIAAVSGGLSATDGLRPDRDAAPTAYFDVAVVVTVFMLAIRWFDARAKSNAGLAARALHRAQARTADVLQPSGVTEPLPAAALQPGQRCVVAPGAVIPADGVVEDGQGGVDEQLLTGERGRVAKAPGDALLSGTRVLDGHLTLRVTATQPHSALQSIVRTIRDAQYGRPPTQAIADRCTEVLVPTVAAAALATLALWLAAGETASFAFGTMLAVLVVGCPCALALAVSAPQLVGTGQGARLGLLLRDPQSLAATREIDVAVFGRAGTLAGKRMQLESITTAVGISEGQVLRLVGALESASDHPAAQAVTDAAYATVGHLPPVSDFVAHGEGAEGLVADRRVVVGRRAFAERLGLSTPPVLSAALERAEQEGKTALAAGWYGEVRSVLVLSDPPADAATAAISDLRTLGVRPVLVTAGGHQEALSAARAVGIDEHDVFAEVVPADRPRLISALQAGGARVAVVGGGERDAAALAAADLAITVGTLPRRPGERGVTVVGRRADGVPAALRLGRRTLAAMEQNIAAAVLVCVVAVPFAMAGFVSPVLGACVMGTAILAAIGNALRLRRFRR